jgi:sortase (surface protein transpeptidase)
LCITAVLATWLVLFLGPLSALKEGRAQSTLYAKFRGELASGVVPPFAPNSSAHRGNPVAILSIPSIGMSREIVVEGTTSGDLENGPGHLPGTVLPGEVGVSTLMGRAFGYGGPFSAIHSLKPGAAITVTTGQGTYHFVVVDARGPGQPIPGSLGSAKSRLMLITAANNGWSNLWVPTHAIWVDAVLRGRAAPVAPGLAAAPADLPMHGNTGALTPLVLWLQLLLIVVVGLFFALRRWNGRQVWVVGVPVIIAVLWGASLQFTQLLPNLL